MMRQVKLFVFVFSLLINGVIYSQTNATPRDLVLANLKINKIQPSDVAFVNSNWTTTFKWYEYYGSILNNEKYLNSINDEFKSQNYKDALIDEISKAKDNFDLSKQYYVIYNLKFGIYNSECQCFQFDTRVLPSYTLLAAKEFGNWRKPLMGSYFDIKLTNFFNFKDFDFYLKLKQSEAENFIASKKGGNGTINRTVQAKVYFNFVSKPQECQKNEYNLGCYIQKIEFSDNGRLISTLYPRTNYFDKVNFIKLNNGNDTVYLESSGKDILKSEVTSKAKYFEIYTYQNGKINGPYIRYTYPGKVLSAKGYIENGEFNGDYTLYFDDSTISSRRTLKNGTPVGKCISWFSNGKKAEEYIYINGEINGPYYQWHDNGKKSYEAFYVKGLKNGCEYKWDENGKCIRGESVAFGNYVDYYENGQIKSFSSKCPCKEENSQAISSEQANRNNSDLAKYKGYFNSSYPDNEYKFHNVGVFYKSNIAEIKRAFISGGAKSSNDADIAIRGGGTLVNHFFIEGFKPLNEKYNFTYSLCTTFENGDVFEKKENIEGYSYVHPFCDFGFDYNTPTIKSNANSKVLYVNFLIKDKNSNAIMQGFYRFIIFK